MAPNGKTGSLRKRIDDLLELREVMKADYARMQPGRAKTQKTVDLAALDATIKFTRGQLAAYDRKKKRTD